MKVNELGRKIVLKMNYPKKKDTRLSGYDEVFLYLETKNVPKMITEKI